MELETNKTKLNLTIANWDKRINMANYVSGYISTIHITMLVVISIIVLVLIVYVRKRRDLFLICIPVLFFACGIFASPVYI